MARTKDPEEFAAKRRQIIDAAAMVFAEHGYDRTSTAQLCAAAGISPGKLYHYFSSKRDVFLAVLTDDQDENADALADLESAVDPDAAVLSFVERLAAPAGAHPIVPKLVLEAMLQSHRDPEIRTALEAVNDDEHAGLERLVRRAIDQGGADPALAPGEAAEWIAAMISALFLEAALSDSFDPQGKLTHLRRAVRGYLAPRA